MKTKKAISDIVTLTLLLFIVLLSFFGLQNWYLSYNNNNIEPFATTQNSDLEIISINTTSIIIKNPNTQPFEINLIKINQSECPILDTLEGNSIKEFSLTSCNPVFSAQRHTIIVETKYDVYRTTKLIQ